MRRSALFVWENRSVAYKEDGDFVEYVYDFASSLTLRLLGWHVGIDLWSVLIEAAVATWLICFR